MKKLTDFQLVELAKGGNQKAFTELKKRHWAWVYYKLFRKTYNATEAADLTAEVFALAFTKIHLYEATAQFGAWIGRIAHNHFITFLRSRHRVIRSKPFDTPTHPNSDMVLADVIADNRLNPEEIILKKESLKRLVSLIEKLPPNARRVIELKYFEELSYEEIAVRIGKAKNSIGPYLIIALKKLKILYEGGGLKKRGRKNGQLNKMKIAA